MVKGVVELKFTSEFDNMKYSLMLKTYGVYDAFFI